MKYIFDFGANKGQNIKYFLQRADRVCAVEAVPEFCSQISHDYAKEINLGRVIVVNAFATKFSSAELIQFYQSKDRPGQSTYLEKKADVNSVKIMVPQISAAEIVNQLITDIDTIEYIKIDTEGADLMVLDSLIENGIFPKYLSIEIHRMDVLNRVLSIKLYQSYRIEKAGKINGYNFGLPVLRVMKYFIVKFICKKQFPIVFSPISSGPYGEDLIGNWLNESALREKIQYIGLGAKDIHAGLNVKAKFNCLSLVFYRLLLKVKLCRLYVVKLLKKVLPSNLYVFLRRYTHAILYLQKRYSDRKILEKFKTFKSN